jgi:prophage maintenance system killer protein
MKDSKTVVYQAKNGAIQLREDSQAETVWASQSEISSLFGIDQSVVSRHIQKVFRENEVTPNSNMQKMHIPNSDKPVAFYSLDVILSIGYKTNSQVAIDFRKWATKTLRSHISDGFTINKSQIGKNYDKFLAAVNDLQALLPESSKLSANQALDLINLFAQTWFSLDAYDKCELPQFGTTKEEVRFTATELSAAIQELKTSLRTKNQASELFAQEQNHGALTGIVGNIFQSAFEQDAYASIEEKAVHLLYFIIKNHPFTDGNKRSGAFAFVWFLSQAGILNSQQISPPALTALTLLIAESDPKEKNRVIGLFLLLLKE